ncbi:hypothetical protein SAMN06269185_3071 [Natronoarchaeum philippinense]|uniref:Uncharacterized protein n=1 Tax=Natronoarchaeum philippinense TaxID=558529 RepID=A0A285P7F7_NATPI|nr:hypothetical protein [Natronoarchaeum philippinense]SNZ17652.1 hypothetical protein SAMN06269185_3071 [Natronoarchaeum philippinense]
MSDPALTEPGGVEVVTLYETRRERERVRSIEDAIEVVAECSDDPVCMKIVTRDDTVVYDSTRNGSIEDWAAEWRLERERLSTSEEVHVCPHDSAGCTADDRCLQCTMDRQIERHSTTR